MTHQLDEETENQINACLDLLKDVLSDDLLGVYLYGSAIVGGLQKYSDIDLFVVSKRPTTHADKIKLEEKLLQISGIYMKSTKRSIEMTIVVYSDINPWHYPPIFDFQYGDWLRKEFESGNAEPWPTKEMPDLAVLITQVLLANKTLAGLPAKQLLLTVPYKDFIFATKKALEELRPGLDTDTRNVLLTYARIWTTLETDSIHSKPDAANWGIVRLPKEYQPVMQRAKAICLGQEKEYWDDIKPLIPLCAKFMVDQIDNALSLLNDKNKFIKLKS